MQHRSVQSSSPLLSIERREHGRMLLRMLLLRVLQLLLNKETGNTERITHELAALCCLSSPSLVAARSLALRCCCSYLLQLHLLLLIVGLLCVSLRKHACMVRMLL